MGSFKSVLTEEQEQMLVKHIRKIDSIFYGLECRGLRKLAFDFAENNKIKYLFKGGCAGEKWLENFVKKNPEVVLRQSESTFIATASGFNRFQVAFELFFLNLENLIDKYKFEKNKIWNVDETSNNTSNFKQII